MKLVPHDWVMAEPQNDSASKILESTKLSNREKMIQFNENLRKNKLKRENSSESAKKPLQSTDEDAKFDFLTPIQKKNAVVLLSKLKGLAGFELIPETGEISIENVRYNGSNVYDLVGDLVSGGKNKDLPLNAQELYKFISKSNLPILYIKNTHRKKIIQQQRSNNAAAPIPVANTPNTAPVAPVALVAPTNPSPAPPPPKTPTTPSPAPVPPKKSLKRLSLKRPRGRKIKSGNTSENRSPRKKHPYLKKTIRFSSSDSE